MEISGHAFCFRIKFDFFFQPRIKVWKYEDLPITMTLILRQSSQTETSLKIFKFGSNASQNGWRLELRPRPRIGIRGWGKNRARRRFFRKAWRNCATWRAPLCGSDGATSLRGLRIDLARRLSDLEMTWLLYFAGAATVGRVPLMAHGH